jgi:hypothetical protein
MQTLVPIGTFEGKARRLLGNVGFEDKPILLLLIYAKAYQDNLTDAQKAQLKKHVDAIIDEFG